MKLCSERILNYSDIFVVSEVDADEKDIWVSQQYKYMYEYRKNYP